MKDEVLKPVFMSVVDGLLEATAGGRAARKKGLTAPGPAGVRAFFL